MKKKEPALLEEACNVEYGTRVVQKRDGGSVYPVYGGGGATFKMDEFNREDRLVIARFGMSEECTRFVTGKFFLNDSGLTVSPRNGAIVPRFLDYQMLSRNDDIYALGKGTAQKNLDVPAFRTMPLFVPDDIAEQHRIVAILDEAFVGLAIAKANAGKNLLSVHAIFESYLQSVYTQRGPGWADKTLGDIAEFKNGLNYSKNSNGQTLPVVGVADFQNNYFVPLSGLDTATIDGNLVDGYALRRDDILTVRSNGSKHLVGRCMLVGDVDEVVSYSGFIIRIRFDTSKVFPKFLLYFMKCKATRDILTSGGGGANITNINQEKLSALPVPLPPYKTQMEIVAATDNLHEETLRLASLYERKIARLEALEKSLLRQAFTGQLHGPVMRHNVEVAL